MPKLGGLVIEIIGSLGVALVAYMVHSTTVVFWTAFVITLLIFVVLHLRTRSQAQ
jgi:uncharacterized protein (DUF983 family)